MAAVFLLDARQKTVPKHLWTHCLVRTMVAGYDRCFVHYMVRISDVSRLIDKVRSLFFADVLARIDQPTSASPDQFGRTSVMMRD